MYLDATMTEIRPKPARGLSEPRTFALATRYNATRMRKGRTMTSNPNDNLNRGHAIASVFAKQEYRNEDNYCFAVSNFIPMAQWDKNNWPPHIHPRRESPDGQLKSGGGAM